MDASHDNEILRAANEALARSVKHLKQDLAEMRESEVEMNAALSRAQEESATLRRELKNALAAAAADHAVTEAANRVAGWVSAMHFYGDGPADAMNALLAALDASRKP